MSESFRWRTARDSLLTDAALQMFQLLASREGADFGEVRDSIDADYNTARGRPPSERHGGNIQSYVQSFREAGWVDLSPDASGKQIIRITPAGKQALVLLSKVPDFLKAAPHFVTELLARYQLNNPARPEIKKDKEYETLLEESNVFPYWTLFKIIRECDSFITAEELRRFVFRLHRSEDIPAAIEKIREFRADKSAGLAEDQINAKYPVEIDVAADQQKYVMAKLGVQVGSHPPVIEKEGPTKWVLNKYYEPLIDEILANPPTFREKLTESSWMQHYGRPVEIPGAEMRSVLEEPEVLELVDEADALWLQAKELIDSGVRTILLIGPPGTSKTWYARRIAARLVNGDSRKLRYVQFHPSYSYEDFVEGYVPSKGETGQLFVPTPKVFLMLCELARRDAKSLYALVIDEFNRGDPSRIFGELLTYLERDYRDKKFLLPYSQTHTSIPDNVVIIGTMNPYDKSVADLDDAMERRFERIPLDPSVDSLKKLLRGAGMPGPLLGGTVEFFGLANKRCRHGLGHALFLRVYDENGLLKLWNYKLRYILGRQFQFEPEIYKELKDAYAGIFPSPPDLM